MSTKYEQLSGDELEDLVKRGDWRAKFELSKREREFEEFEEDIQLEIDFANKPAIEPAGGQYQTRQR